MKKYKIILFLIGLLYLSLPLYAQNNGMGIGTETPFTDVDVNGTTNVNSEIRLGGTDTQAGNPGTAGDLLTANGTSNPEWKNFDLPAGYGEMILASSYIKSTETGITFEGTNNSSVLSVGYNENQDIQNHWKSIEGLSENIVVGNETNFVNVNVQTMVQTDSNDLASCGCGIYIDNQLKAVRTTIIGGGAGSYIMFNLNASLESLPVGEHTVQFACAERLIRVGTTLAIGEPITTDNLNPGMSQSSMTISIFEPGF